MKTWVIQVAQDFTRVAVPLPNGRLREGVRFRGSPEEIVDRLVAHLERQYRNERFNFLVLNADRSKIKVFRTAFEPDLARLILVEDDRDNSDRDLDHLSARYEQHAEPKGRGKKWR